MQHTTDCHDRDFAPVLDVDLDRVGESSTGITNDTSAGVTGCQPIAEHGQRGFGFLGQLVVPPKERAVTDAVGQLPCQFCLFLQAA